MEATPHVLIAGTGATLFALKQGLEFAEAPSRYYVTAVGVRPSELEAPGLSHGTVGAVALDTSGHLAAATSTGGIFGKLEGRVGDTPLIGSGTWADDEVAVSCTGLGEYFILSGGAYDISARVKYQGATMQQAADGLIAQMGNLGGNGGLIAVSHKGEATFSFNGQGMKRSRISSTQELEVLIF
jgi:isoaspartyl peptidase/L-asparaginase-like protein (Ntn-hydrolase superfamily)